MSEDHKTKLAKMKAETAAMRAALDAKVSEAKQAVKDAETALHEQDSKSTDM